MGVHTAGQICWLGIIIKTWESKISRGISAKRFESKRFRCKEQTQGDSAMLNIVSVNLF